MVIIKDVKHFTYWNLSNQYIASNFEIHLCFHNREKAFQQMPNIFWSLLSCLLFPDSTSKRKMYYADNDILSNLMCLDHFRLVFEALKFPAERNWLDLLWMQIESGWKSATYWEWVRTVGRFCARVIDHLQKWSYCRM